MSDSQRDLTVEIPEPLGILLFKVELVEEAPLRTNHSMSEQGHREDKSVLLVLLMSSVMQADLPTGTLDLPHCHASADSPASSWLEIKTTEPGSNGHHKALSGDARRTEDPQGTCLETRGSLTQEASRSHVVLWWRAKKPIAAWP